MGKRIEIEVDGSRTAFTLLAEWAPKTTSLLWEILPLEKKLLRHGKLSGDACWIVAEDPRLARLPERNELAVTSIYKGYIVADLRPQKSAMELLISYGLAEYRWPDGRRYVTPVAEIEGNGAALYVALQRTWTEGQRTLAIRRVE